MSEAPYINGFTPVAAFFKHASSQLSHSPKSGTFLATSPASPLPSSPPPFLLPVLKLCHDDILQLSTPIPEQTHTPGHLHTSTSISLPPPQPPPPPPPRMPESVLSPSPRINNTTTAAHGAGLPRHGKADINTTAALEPYLPARTNVFFFLLLFSSPSGRLARRLMQDVKGTAMPVPAADATTDAVQRNDAPVCAPVAGSPVGLTCRQI